MARLFVLVEGPTEEMFVNEVLAPHLYAVGWTSVGARIVGNARLRAHRGGIRSWPSARGDIANHFREDPTCHVTTMVDYYALPFDWPGRADSSGQPVGQRAAHVQTQLSASIQEELGPNFESDRFIPFVLLHEFEALLFSDCQTFADSIGKPASGVALQAVRNQFANPEEINDSPLTAPSKRIIRIIPGYDKPLLGSLGALGIGLSRMREECPHFGSWLGRLEQSAAG